MAVADDDRARAVKEVAQVYERIKAQHPLLLLHVSSSSQSLLLAQSLLGDALRALNVALSVMKQQPPPPAAAAAARGAGPAPATTTPTSVVVVKAESPPSPAASADSQAAVVATITARRAKKRRSSSSAMEEAAGKTSSWVDFTSVPYEDGYEWRKYGEKKINGTSHTRSYFRCTYKDDTGCLATKHVQQQDTSSDPPVFQVTYNNHHTCCKNCTATTTTAINNDSRSEGVTAISCRNDHAATNIKQEQTPPVLIEVSAALPFDGAPSSSMTSSCISGESWDEYPAAAGDMAHMAAAEASAGYELLYDPELFVLCTSFKVY